MRSVLEVPSLIVLWENLRNFKKYECMSPNSRYFNLIVLNCMNLSDMVFKSLLDDSMGWHGCLHQSPANSSTLFMFLVQVWAKCSNLLLLLRLDIAVQSLWYHLLTSAIPLHFHFGTLHILPFKSWETSCPFDLAWGSLSCDSCLSHSCISCVDIPWRYCEFGTR